MKTLKITPYETFDEALSVAKETTHKYSWYASSELSRTKRINNEFPMKYIVTESLEAYSYHDKIGYNYMTKVEAGGSLTSSRPRLCVLKEDGTLIVTKLTINGDDKKWEKVAKLAHTNPSTFKYGLDLYDIEIEEGDIIIWTKESMSPSTYHKK